jgi:L-threonylcarbamoyladenylate synthase
MLINPRIAYEDDIQACMAAMHAHGLILYPSETHWCLGCHALDDVAIAKLMSLKPIKEMDFFELLMTDHRQLSRFLAAPLPDLSDRLAQFDSPTTVVYSNAIELTHELLTSDGSIAIRLTTDPFCRSLIKRMKAPLLAVPAFQQHEPPPMGLFAVSSFWKDKADYQVKWRQEERTFGQTLHVVRLEPDGSFSKLR